MVYVFNCSDQVRHSPPGKYGLPSNTPALITLGSCLSCNVFNCSDQMDYRVMGGIYKGLAQVTPNMDNKYGL